MSNAYAPISLADKLALLPEQWQPRVVAEMNDYQFKVVRIEGDFVWHQHAETDETFLVIDVTLRIDFRDGAVTLGPGEMFVVPGFSEPTPVFGLEPQEEPSWTGCCTSRGGHLGSRSTPPQALRAEDRRTAELSGFGIPR